MSSSLQPPSSSNRWLLRRVDQAAIAACCLFGLVALGIYWAAQGGLRGRLIEIDHADKAGVDFKVDINTAGANELITIPEIGPALAQRIVQYRQQHGPFHEIEDLRHVRGIGPKTFERLGAYVLPLNGSKAATDAAASQEGAAASS